MEDRSYWLNLCTGTAWQEFLDAGAEVTGFRERRWKTVQKIRPGDYLLCYLTGVSRWIGILEVVSEGFRDESPIWKDDAFPCRVKVKVVAGLTPETAVPVFEHREQLSIFQNLKSPNAWTGWFRGSPREFNAADGRVIAEAVMEAERNPVTRPVDPAKLARRPAAPTGKRAVTVTVPAQPEARTPEETALDPARLDHWDAMAILLELGNLLAYDTYTSDPSKSSRALHQGLGEIARVRELPPFTYERYLETVRNIDVIWLSEEFPSHCFEVEHTTGVTTGLLRLYQIRNFTTARFFIVSPADIISRYRSQIAKDPFYRIQDRYWFRSYDDLVVFYEQAKKYHNLSQQFLGQGAT